MRTLLAASLLLVTTAALAEIQLPEASPASTITHEIGISKVTIAFHRPGIKGRQVWGELVPTGKVWRLGANNATTLELSHDAKVNGHAVPAGKYALFAIPDASKWTMILNKKHDQWGAYFYKAEEDQLRFDVRPEAAELTEWFDVDLVPVSDRALRVDFTWEKVRVPFTIEFDVPALVWKQIDATLAASPTWEDWHQAARYAYNTNQRLDDALVWIDKAMATESFWNYELKGMLLHKKGRTEEALPLMAKAKELAKGKAPQEWLDGVDKTVAGWKKK
ncbi:MAG TPA: DUF2911 domain-containing protein [Thermoanaerobaculia bacterium]|nr:DUF2911 domain-containing protein [Thermoanaerobaculia bacterium]